MSGNVVKGSVEYRNPPLAGEDMPRKPLDGMRALNYCCEGEESFPPPPAFTASDGGSGAAPPDRGQGACPLGTVGGNPDRGECSCLGTNRGAEPLLPARASYHFAEMV